MTIEEELHASLKSGSKDRINATFEKIYNSYFKLGMFVSRQYLDSQDAVEVVDEVFVSLFEKLLKEQKCDIRNIKQYICVSIKNKAIKESKRIENTTTYDENIEYESNEKIYVGNKLLEELDEIEQYIITEHIFIGKTFKEIAKDLHKPLNTVKSIYRRGCQKAKRRLTWVEKR